MASVCDYPGCGKPSIGKVQLYHDLEFGKPPYHGHLQPDVCEEHRAQLREQMGAIFEPWKPKPKPKVSNEALPQTATQVHGN